MIPVPAAAVRSSKSAADGEHMKIKLQTVIDAIEQASEYSIMDSFVDYLPPGRMKNELGAAIRGRGAFRRFKQTIRFHGIEQLWYDYQADAYRELAERWCRDNDVEYE